MRVAPNRRGNSKDGVLKPLDALAERISLNDGAIYGAGPASQKRPRGCRYTPKRTRLYPHVQTWPFREIHIEGLGRKVKYAQFLHDASELHWLDPDADVDSNIGVAVGEGILTLELPVLKPDVVTPVIELILKD